ncbi:MAG: RNA repair transcriptional activator RtcR [Planctomycetales bacterium]|nr:RNA repair transcriptional activator RtcR [Planctomycetales bacterium]
MNTRTNVVIGLVGAKLDRGAKLRRPEERWERWRPTVAICQQPDFLVDRFVLLHTGQEQSLADTLCQDLAVVSPETRVETHTLAYDDPWNLEQVYAALHGFAGGYEFQPEREDYLVHITTGTHVAQICLFLLTESRHLPGRLLQSSPPKRPMAPPCGDIQVIDLDLSRYDALARRFAAEEQDDVSFLKSGIATRNTAFNDLISRIERVAIRSRDPLLLQGPTGAGKTELARRIYELKKRRRQITGPFVEVNCATIRGDQAMSALFGHEAGAFTGAAKARDGLLRKADQGLLFLDEVAELGSDEQAMLLRAVEDKRFLPVGADAEVAVNFQLIAGTNCDLRERTSAGMFRHDLLARINLWTFVLPGLVNRREDIAPNLDYELQRLGTESGRRVTINREARDLFLQFACSSAATWDGNFRDLGSAVRRMDALCRAGRIDVAQVREEMERLQSSWRATESHDGSAEAVLGTFLTKDQINAIDSFDRPQLAHVLQVCQASPSLSAAGRQLFQASRERKTTSNDADRLRKYLARFQLTWEAIT